ncbi:MAG TPA: alpha/beta hydrolase [Stellaceae bacterium]|nr:alpha/beta hydrolase [Stellaceae bacterium]
MPQATARDGTKLHYESEGSGPPIVFVHELAGTLHSFAPQVAAMKDRFRCIAYNARGYPPSDVPPNIESYSQDIAAEDIGAVLDACGVDSAHVMGVSMGSAAALQFALAHPERTRSVILCSIGSGSDVGTAAYAVDTEARAQAIEQAGMADTAKNFGNSPTRIRLKAKNPALYESYLREVGKLSLLGMTNTMRGVQKRRPPIYAHEARVKAMKVPALILVGGDDEPCLNPSRFLEEKIPGAYLVVMPETGHGLNLEDPVGVNGLVVRFIDGVERKR